MPFLLLLVFWLTVIFATFGLFSPPELHGNIRLDGLRPFGGGLTISHLEVGHPLCRADKNLQCPAALRFGTAR